MDSIVIIINIMFMKFKVAKRLDLKLFSSQEINMT